MNEYVFTALTATLRQARWQLIGRDLTALLTARFPDQSCFAAGPVLREQVRLIDTMLPRRLW
jgi:hypothetical protein